MIEMLPVTGWLAAARGAFDRWRARPVLLASAALLAAGMPATSARAQASPCAAAHASYQADNPRVNSLADAANAEMRRFDGLVQAASGRALTAGELAQMRQSLERRRELVNAAMAIRSRIASNQDAHPQCFKPGSSARRRQSIANDKAIVEGINRTLAEVERRQTQLARTPAPQAAPRMACWSLNAPHAVGRNEHERWLDAQAQLHGQWRRSATGERFQIGGYCRGHCTGFNFRTSQNATNVKPC
ncbi:MAG: hypothetical protein KIT25_22140 [Enhydrobacter sp.]|nr:MAG: hypothetical protein KIT25_22140 [Enhydrobacter sp.]